MILSKDQTNEAYSGTTYSNVYNSKKKKASEVKSTKSPHTNGNFIQTKSAKHPKTQGMIVGSLAKSN